MLRPTARLPLPLLLGAVAICAILAAYLWASAPVQADDRQLLRFNTAKPYLFLLFDSSGSFALDPNDNPVPANMDDPASRLYSAKKVLYNALKDVNDVQFGFAQYGQDNLRIRAKHWLYSPDPATPLPGSAATWPLQISGLPYPASTDMMVFGKHYSAGTTGSPVGTTSSAGGVFSLGTCAAPIALSAANRTAIDRFAKLEVISDLNGNGYADSNEPNAPVSLFLSSGGSTYRLTFDRPLTVSGSPNNNLRFDNVSVILSLQRVSNACAVLQTYTPVTINLKINSQYPYGFIMAETAGASAGATATDDASNGWWNWSDLLQSASCTSAHPFTGNGWEGNYDSTFSAAPPARNEYIGIPANTDFYFNKGDQENSSNSVGPSGHVADCPDRNSPGTCNDLNFQTQFASSPLTCGSQTYTNVSPLDRGDVVPFDWGNPNRDTVLKRFAPNHPDATPDFGVASYFTDLPDASGYLPLKDAGRKPMIAAAPSPLAKSENDFRCWYLGSDANKCHNNSKYPIGGWEALANCSDPDWGCKQVYFIIISDGNDNCGGESATADVSNLQIKSGVRTFVVDYNSTNCTPSSQHKCQDGKPPLSSICQAGSPGQTGKLYCAGTESDLQAALNEILGIIREQTRAFASAAVPTVQANVADKIYLADFTPAAGSSTWEGHVESFLKPLPLDPNTGRPDLTKLCSSQPANQQSNCFAWDAATAIMAQVPAVTDVNQDDYLGSNANQRRIFYSRLTTNGSWTQARRLFDQTTNTTSQAIRYDLWRGFQMTFDPDVGAALSATGVTTQTEINSVILATEKRKTHTFTDPFTGATRTDTYILGDIFHSDPLIIGTPQNTLYFALNVGSDQNGLNPACTRDNTNTDKSYQCFARRSQYRRKLVLAGSNDGMLHVIDAGRPSIAGTSPNQQVNFDNGSGQEAFAYIPRRVLPAIRTIAEGTNQVWTVDGTVQAADVFIDPLHSGTPVAANREWRTVALTGLREGGRAYVALDMTQPDTLTVATVAGGGQVFVPNPTSYIPNCLGNPDDVTNPAVTGCGRFPFPAALWEFRDAAHNSDGSIALDANGQPILLDEDPVANGFGDLGDTWSIPAIGRIRVTEGGSAVDKHVAVFGGGLDRDTKTAQFPNAGNWLYMVDIETGHTLYKQRLEGAAPAEPAAVDTNQDGYIDRIYIGTTYGWLYRVDIGANASGHYPSTEAVSTRGTDGLTYTEQRVVHDPDSGALTWVPYKIFNASTNNGVAAPVRPIYYRTSVSFVARLGRYAVSFGTGDREDLWSADTQQNRFYLFVDDSDQTGVVNPINESALASVTPDGVAQATGVDYLTGRLVGQRGWFITFDAKERTITPALTLLGLATVSTYSPETCFGTFDANGHCITNNNQLCSKGGTSRIFVTLASNGNGVLYDLNNNQVRYMQEKTFVTPPYVEQAQTKNPNPGAQTTGSNADQLTSQLTSVMNSLKALYPAECKFANYRQDIKTVSGDTGVIFIAPVPICIIEKNWKEF